MRSEYRLILQLTRTHVTPEGHKAVEDLLAQPLDWDYLIALLDHNHVTSVFAYHATWMRLLEQNPRKAYLSQRLMETARYNLILKGRLQIVLQTLQAAQIRAVPFKGPTLAESIYGNIALRQFGDLDILIDRAQYDQAAAVLLGLGYTLRQDLAPPEDAEHKQVDATFEHSTARDVIELHWKLISPFWLQQKIPDNWWEYVTPYTLGTLETEVFQDEFLFVYLCFHGYKHGWERLSWLVDIAAMITQRPQLDWQRIEALAQRFGITDIVDTGVLLATILLDAHVPANVMERVRAQKHLMRLVPLVQEIQCPDPRSLEIQHSKGDSKFLFQMALAGPRQKVRLILLRYIGISWKPNQADRSWIRLPKQLDFLYYVVRPVRLAYRFVTEQIRLIGTTIRQNR